MLTGIIKQNIYLQEVTRKMSRANIERGFAATKRKGRVNQTCYETGGKIRKKTML